MSEVQIGWNRSGGSEARNQATRLRVGTAGEHVRTMREFGSSVLSEGHRVDEGPVERGLQWWQPSDHSP